MTTRLILIRHGQTDWNLQKRYSGFVDVSLNPAGKKQIKKLQQRLKQEKVHKVYSSDRKRAIESAKIIFKEYTIKKIPDLREIHFGIFEGLTYKQIIKKYPDVYKKWFNNPFNISIPKGENLKVFKKRVIRAFKKIISHHKNESVAIVFHGGAISVLINHILKTNDFWKHIPHSASLSIVEYRNGKACLRLFDDTSHLNKQRKGNK